MKRLVVAILAMVVLVAGIFVALGLDYRLGPLRNCPDLLPFAQSGPNVGTSALEAACELRQNTKPARVGDVTIYGKVPRATQSGLMRLTRSSFAHATAVLGKPTYGEITVYAVPIRGPIRGMSFAGGVLLDISEIDADPECVEFIQSAGIQDGCLSWVIAHEVAHQWFAWTARLGEPTDRVAWEATADYLAFDWWRSKEGLNRDPDLIRELIRGRMKLSPQAVALRVPAGVSVSLTDKQDRAIVYGRGSGGWLAIEQEVGRDLTIAVLREVLASHEEMTLSAGSVAAAAGRISPSAQHKLREWWFSRTVTFQELLDELSAPANDSG